jgi:hypothetical protein
MAASSRTCSGPNRGAPFEGGHNLRRRNRPIGGAETATHPGTSVTAMATIHAAQIGKLPMVLIPPRTERGHLWRGMVDELLTGGERAQLPRCPPRNAGLPRGRVTIAELQRKRCSGPDPPIPAPERLGHQASRARCPRGILVLMLAQQPSGSAQSRFANRGRVIGPTWRVRVRSSNPPHRGSEMTALGQSSRQLR